MIKPSRCGAWPTASASKRFKAIREYPFRMASVACKRLLSAALGKSVRGVTGTGYSQCPVTGGGFTSTGALATVEVKRLGDKGLLRMACFEA